MSREYLVYTIIFLLIVIVWQWVKNNMISAELQGFKKKELEQLQYRTGYDKQFGVGAWLKDHDADGRKRYNG